ncbi:MAG TPA: SDR family NAD(P)-dependent oxidoreductase [Streptosporangiaceae bacterium]
MPTQELSGAAALVTGASRGFGRAIAIAIALAKHGAHVVGVTRDRARLEELHAQLGGTFTPSPLTPPTRWSQASSSTSTAPIPAFLDGFGPALTPEQVGTAIVDIVTGPGHDRDAYLLIAAGLSPGQ